MDDKKWQAFVALTEWHLITTDKIGFGLTPSIGLYRIK